MGTTKQAVAEAKPKRPKQEMSVIIRGAPPTFNWGWFSREDQRMHVQTVDRAHLHLHYKVWLENRGRRVIQPEPGIPPKVFKALETVIVKERERLDAEWAAFMIARGWLKVGYSAGVITLYAYPNTPNHIERTIELSELIGNGEMASKVTAKEVVLNEELACLEIYPQKPESRRLHEPLGRILWVD